MIEVRLLGPVEVHAAGRVWDVGPPQRCCVLAVLAHHVNRVIPADVLVDRVWGDRPPHRARRSLAAHVTRLRRLLEEASAGEAGAVSRAVGSGEVRLVSVSGGYKMEAEPAQVDLGRFRDLVKLARSGVNRVPLLREALDLFRGRPLSGLDGDWARSTRDAWCRDQVDAAVMWARDAVSDEAVVARLTELHLEYPLAEPLAAALVRSLVAAGRAGDAADVYAAMRARLAAELDVEPGSALRQAFHSGFRPPAQLPLPVAGFAGRSGELARLDQPAAVTVLTGPAGVGKTALGLAWAHRARARFPDGQLYADLSRCSVPAALSGFLEALGTPTQDQPSTVDSKAALYRTLVADRRILVFIDGASTADQVRPLLPGALAGAVVVTSRDSLVELVATVGARPVAVGPLPTGDARRLLVNRIGRERVVADLTTVDTIIQQSRRVPSLLARAAARAALEPEEPLDRVLADLWP